MSKKSSAHGLKFTQKSLTKQAMRDQVDVNNIVRRYTEVGAVPQMRQDARYGDFSHGEDYHSIMNRVTAAQSDFMELPAAVRQHFQNDVGQLLDAMADPDRDEELVELGLRSRETPAERPEDHVAAVAADAADMAANPSDSEANSESES